MILNHKFYLLIFVVTAIACLISAIGCVSSGPRGIAVIELETMKRHRTRTGFREFIVSANDHKQCFYTLEYTDDNNLVLRQRDYQAALKRTAVFPGVKLVFYDRAHAVSDDGKRVVFLDTASSSIKMWDSTDNTGLTLMPYASGGAGALHIRAIEFISDDEILIVLNRDPDFARDEAQLLKYHIPSQILTVVKTIPRLSRHVSLSPSGRFLAYIDRGVRGNLGVIDLANGEVIESQINKPGDSPSAFSWSPDETRIVYFSGTARAIYLYDIARGERTVVRDSDSNADILCYNLLFIGDDYLLYNNNFKGSSPLEENLWIVEIASGEIVQKIKNARVWGSLTVLDDGRRIAYVYR